MADTMLANVCKQNVTRFHFEVAWLAPDLAGGFIATLPSQYDLESEWARYLGAGFSLDIHFPAFESPNRTIYPCRI